jgi:hypothetical protein
MKIMLKIIDARAWRVASPCLLLACAAPAHAYVDPGTGSMLIQLAAASIAGVLFFLRDLRHRIFAWFSRRRDRVASDDAVEHGE